MIIKNGVISIDTSIDPRIKINNKNITKGIPIESMEVQWTGNYPNLCSGNWIFKFNGNYLPSECDSEQGQNDNYVYEHFLTQSFNVHGTYDTWSFGPEYEENWSTYEDGLEFDEFLLSDQFLKLNELFKKNDFFLNSTDLKILYTKIQEHDWRNNSCGGCI